MLTEEHNICRCQRRKILSYCIISRANSDISMLKMHDIPCVFLQAKQPKKDKDAHITFNNRIDELLANISPETYQEYVHHKRGHVYIYCKLKVALHGALCAALLFWKKLT